MYLRMLTNEMNTPLSLKAYPKHNFIFEIESWFDQWLEILDEHELVNNQLEDYIDLCEGVQCIKKDLSVSQNKHCTHRKH